MDGLSPKLACRGELYGFADFAGTDEQPWYKADELKLARPVAGILRVEIRWHELDDERDPAWLASFCLYAYLHPERNWLLYIGKADNQTVHQRTHGDHKADLFDYLCKRYDIEYFRILQGDLVLEEGRRRSSELLSLVESLLIMRLQPPGNIASTLSRQYRPGLRVYCGGDWPIKRAGFHDWD